MTFGQNVLFIRHPQRSPLGGSGATPWCDGVCSALYKAMHRGALFFTVQRYCFFTSPARVRGQKDTQKSTPPESLHTWIQNTEYSFLVSWYKCGAVKRKKLYYIYYNIIYII